MSRVGYWLRERWWRLMDRCPSCGATLDSGIVGIAPAVGCHKCGWYGTYAIDGSRFEHWPRRSP